MKLHARSFSGKTFLRPSPVIKDSSHHIIVMTPWNASHSDAQKWIHSFQEIYSQLSDDKDSTRPFQDMLSLSPEENNIRMTCMQINNHLFNQYNKDELKLGFEVFFAVRTETEFIFAQVGNPQVYLFRKNCPMQMIGQNVSLSIDHSSFSSQMAPLPSALLGLFPDVSVSIRSLKIQEEDQIILVSRTFIPADFLKCTQPSLEALGHILAQDKVSEPFWLGQIVF